MEENNKFWSMNGYIGRRSFILNWAYVCLFKAIIFSTPVLVYCLSHTSKALDYLVNQSASVLFPKFFIIYAVIFTIVKWALLFPSVVRRVRDIIGNDNRFILSICAVLIVLIFLTGDRFGFLFLLILACLDGKITSEKPQNDTEKFNLGAFFGTWIWGLNNKCYKTLWGILLCFTPGMLAFMVICGIKGNKWALKSKKYENIENLQTSQSKQGMIWMIAFPFLLVAYFAVIIVGVGAALLATVPKQQDFNFQINRTYLKLQNKNTERVFDEITTDEDLYVFTIKPVVWDKLSVSQKHNLFENAGIYALSKDKEDLVASENPVITGVPADILNKIVIKSSFNEEVLAKCEINNAEGFPKECEFNLYPSVP